jgi:hypothetical protein
MKKHLMWRIFTLLDCLSKDAETRCSKSYSKTESKAVVIECPYFSDYHSVVGGLDCCGSGWGFWECGNQIWGI